jgi:chemotaxis receptor (MCP) glutamine deamidase CheD
MRESGSNREPHLGSRNVEIALEMLTKIRIPVMSTVVGMDRGQRIVFHTDTGDSEVKVL